MKSRLPQRNFISFLAGFLFAIGLAISGMTQPQKVIGFLSPWEWDPSLAFVMIGAIGVHLMSYLFIRKKASPLLDTQWHVPTQKDVTGRLILGSSIFGVGWGLGGFCPGPGVTSLASGDSRAVLFVAAMIGGMILFTKTERFIKLRK